MESKEFEQWLSRWNQLLPALNDPLEAWGKRLVNTFAPSWTKKLGLGRTPLEADPRLRQRFDAITLEMAEVYCTGNEEQRARMRSLLQSMKGVRYFMSIACSAIRTRDDEATFRLALVFESMADLREDTRDVILTLDDLCRAGRRAGIDVNCYLREVAALSSDIDRHGMGSMRRLLLREARE